MKKLLIIHRSQFGYSTDVYKWCQFLNDNYIIDTVCFDYGRKRFVMNNVHVHYVSRRGIKVFRGFRYLLCCVYYICRHKGVVIINCFYGSRILKKILPWRKMVLDIRTFSVTPDDNIRAKENEYILNTVRKFDYVTVISEGLRNQLPKDKSLTALLPLGADIIDTGVKEYNEINLLYVGTLENRDIDKTIRGVAIAKEKLGEKIHYHIIGGGYNREEFMLKSLIDDLGLSDTITVHGFIPHNELYDFYRKCNVGVSFVPITPYYQYQPPTKTFEYIMAGLYTIATATNSNKDIITPDNGILILDTPDSFADAIIKIAGNNSIDSGKIRNSLNDYQWSVIVNQRMVPTLNYVERLFGLGEME